MVLIEELKRRKVFRVAGVYGVTAWVITEVSATVLPALQLPDKLLTIIVVLLILGFPIAMVLAWIFDIEAGAIQRTQPLQPVPSDAPGSLAGSTVVAENRRLVRRLFNFGLLVLVTLALGAFFFWRVDAQQSGPRDSIAVLPFINLSSSEESDYFSDGMAEELLNLLTRVPGLKVAARTSSFAYKNSSSDVRSIGRELGVATVLEGSVRWSNDGQRVRVTAQLIDTQSGYHLWSETYDRRLEDIFLMQDEISRTIVGKLKLQLDQQPDALPVPPTRDIEAYQLYLKGRSLWEQGSLQTLEQSIGYFQKAISRDPGFARAYANLAAAYVLLPDYSEADATPVYSKASEAALKALTIDETLADAHAVLARISYRQWAWNDAESGFYFAVSLSPGEPLAHQWYAQHLAAVGRLNAAVQQRQLAQALNPEYRAIEHQPEDSSADALREAIGAGNLTRAFQVAERLVSVRRLPLAELWRDEFSEFRRDQRFPKLVDTAGLIHYWRRYGYPDACHASVESVVCR